MHLRSSPQSSQKAQEALLMKMGFASATSDERFEEDRLLPLLFLGVPAPLSPFSAGSSVPVALPDLRKLPLTVAPLGDLGLPALSGATFALDQPTELPPPIARGATPTRKYELA
eukprot:CAMPEP_0170617494 /NCGR_PEP_ID=MMETSP0224-20130122/26450_1 /TAXON_ID=285029 /ORGANISM="Togula jolla, Strain CCCM 725" /LENGTH=113 /DNA_ID=CAMNT_0010943395 /DNA_START=215 /DNA_END=552 /DNA_ORIENTATION=+